MRGKRVRLVLIGVVALLVALAVAGYPVYVSPRTDQVSLDAPADAVVALGGSPESGEKASQLFEQGYAARLVLSNPYGRAKNTVTRLCKGVAAGDSGKEGVSCFVPDPSTTRGEAQKIAWLAEMNGWDRVVVVAPVFHLSRARMIFGRCYTGDLLMVDADVDIGLPMWIYHYGYQTAGYLKAFTQRGC